MSHLSPIDAPQVYFEPLRDEESCDRLEDVRERHERSEEIREDGRDGFRERRFERERFERFERDRLDHEPGPHPLPRL